jgi:transcriptional regulator with XRE-family HTH domain
VDAAQDLSKTLGEMIRQQRELAALPMRQFAAMVGISNPYLSQIEHGLRVPSEQVLRAMAEALSVTAGELGVNPGEHDGTGDSAAAASAAMLAAIKTDPNLTVKQRRALTEVYLAMVEATAAKPASNTASQLPVLRGRGSGFAASVRAPWTVRLQVVPASPDTTVLLPRPVSSRAVDCEPAGLRRWRASGCRQAGQAG